MAYIVTENCIRCKHQECVEVCPVDYFYEGENFVVINPRECIDCGMCEHECPVNAIVEHTEAGKEWIDINIRYAKVWPKITTQGTPPADCEKWVDVDNKL